MGTLKTQRIDLNSKSVVQTLITVASKLAERPPNKQRLEFSPSYYFSVPNGSVPASPGWYIIIWNSQPIYVGTAQSLHDRLNTQNGSIDNFALKSRTSDSERNYIKKFLEIGIIADLEVLLLTEVDFVKLAGEHLCTLPTPLSKSERQSIEKLLNIFRAHVVALTR